MVKHHRILRVEQDDDILVLVPVARDAGFRYADLQGELNAARRAFDLSDAQRVVADLGELDYIGSEMIGAVVMLLRQVTDRGGRAAMCGASERLQEALAQMNLARVWPYYPTRAEALAALRSGPVTAD